MFFLEYFKQQIDISMWRLKNNILLQMESWIWRKKTQNTIILESETKNRVVQRLAVILVCSHSALLYISGYTLVRQPKKCRYIHTLYTYQENYRAWIFCLVFHALWSQQQFSSTFFSFSAKTTRSPGEWVISRFNSFSVSYTCSTPHYYRENTTYLLPTVI